MYVKNFLVATLVVVISGFAKAAPPTDVEFHEVTKNMKPTDSDNCWTSCVNEPPYCPHNFYARAPFFLPWYYVEPCTVECCAITDLRDDD